MTEKTILWDRPTLVRFKKAYEAAKPGGRDTVFTFDGNEYLVSYAGYLIEHLDSTLPRKGE